MESPATGCFNLGIGRGYSVREVVTTCERVTGRAIPCVEEARREGDPAELVSDPSKARAAFDWQPRYQALEPIIESAWEWHHRHPRGYPSASEPALRT